MIKFARSVSALAVTALLALALLSACGGDDGEATPTPAAGTPTAVVTATPVATTPAAPTTPGQVTLEITDISPSPAKVGDTVTITFKTQPKNFIGLQVTDPNGQIAIQTQLTAGADGTAVLDQTVKLAGEWKVEAAAGRSIADLLALQINPKPGPHSDDATFEVQ